MAVDDNYHRFPSFFKIILEPKDTLIKMGIPKQFMTNYGSDLSKVVTLKTPTGYSRKVELETEGNGKTLLGNGWPEFVEYNSICHAMDTSWCLPMQLILNFQFHVYIFDTTACEIEYPLPPPLHSCTPSSSLKAKDMVALVQQCRREVGTLTKCDIMKINSNSHKFEKPSFVAMMQPSYVKFKFSLNVTSTFAAEYMMTAKGRITLENTKGETWQVSCVAKNAKHTKISSGWKEFALDNNLQVGDICVFVLIDHPNRLFKVEIIRCYRDWRLKYDEGRLTSHLSLFCVKWALV